MHIFVHDLISNFRQYDQDFFKEMHEETGVDLENIVYYKDEVRIILFCFYIIFNNGYLNYTTYSHIIIEF